MTSSKHSAKRTGSRSRSASPSDGFAPDYPLQGSRLDVPLSVVLGWSPTERHRFILRVLKALDREMRKGTMTLKRRVPFKREMRDLRALLKTPVDNYLRLDELTFKQNVLMTGAPGKTHTFWSRYEMWKMATKFGDLRREVAIADSKLVKRLEALLDPTNQSKATYRGGKKVHAESVLKVLYRYVEQQYNLRGAFPPIHARFLANRYLPTEGDSIVVDPCAGGVVGSWARSASPKGARPLLRRGPNRHNQGGIRGTTAAGAGLV